MFSLVGYRANGVPGTGQRCYWYMNFFIQLKSKQLCEHFLTGMGMGMGLLGLSRLGEVSAPSGCCFLCLDIGADPMVAHRAVADVFLRR